jgi:D-threo-aldose 1-dehydrogenase
MGTTLKKPMERIGLGTVQFGLDYGISNKAGQVSRAEIDRILVLARDRGIHTIDTAAAYGGSEDVLASALDTRTKWRVVTKTARLAMGLDAVVARARRSAAALGRVGLDTILVHAASDLDGPDGQALWHAICTLKDEGTFARIGISAYVSDDPAGLARRFCPDVMQVPVSLLDQRLVISGQLERIAELGVEIHVRSIFLQGLLFMQQGELPLRLMHVAHPLREIAAVLREAGVTPLRAAVGYVLSRPEISLAVCGVTSAAELREIADAAGEGCPELPWWKFAMSDPVVLDPSQWGLSTR